MPCLLFRPLLSAALLLALASPQAQAQTGAFRVKPLRLKAINGLSAQESGRFQASVEALSAHLAALPSFANPPAPLCIELSREIWGVPLLPMGQALISYNYLAPLRSQTCETSNIVNSNIVFALNHLSFIDKNNRVIEDAQGIVIQPAEYRELGEGLYKVSFSTREYWVMTRGEAPLLPASMARVLSHRIAAIEQRQAEAQQREERHKEWWQDLTRQYGPELQGAPAITRDTALANRREQQKTQEEGRQAIAKELQVARAELEQLTPEQRALPACTESLRGGMQQRTVPGPCRERQQVLLGINPALQAETKDHAALRVVVLEAMSIRHSTEMLAHFEHRQALVKGLDFAALSRAWQAASR